MLVSWKYRDRDTIIQRLDPRARIIFLACVILGITVPQIWDIRILLPLFLLIFGLYLLARIEWEDIRRAWKMVLLLMFFIVFLNALIAGRGGPSAVLNEANPVVLAQTPEWCIFAPAYCFRIQITAARVWFAVTQVVRILTMAILAIQIPYTFDPSMYGVTFRRMGLPDKASFSLDLAFRFVPTFGQDFATTLDAQRARGYEVDSLGASLATKIRRIAPLLVPVVMQAIVGGEDVIDAMDLRAFGTHKRTWLKWDALKFKLRDYLFVGLGLSIMLGLFVLGFSGRGEFWIPEWFLEFAYRNALP